MADKGEPEDGTDIQVTPPEVEPEVPARGAKKVLDKPTEVVHRLRRRYRRLNKRDKFAVLLAVLAIVMFLVIMSIWSSGGGIGGPGLGPEVRPPSDWNVDALEERILTGDEENTNLEGQETPYLAPINPAPGEIYLVTGLSCQVDWADESTPPTSVPAIGYTNQPDGFYLIIRIHDGVVHPGCVFRLFGLLSGGATGRHQRQQYRHDRQPEGSTGQHLNFLSVKGLKSI